MRSIGHYNIIQYVKKKKISRLINSIRMPTVHNTSASGKTYRFLNERSKPKVYYYYCYAR